MKSYYKNLSKKERDKQRPKAKTISCECGCGGELLNIDSRGRPRGFIRGHHNRLKDYSNVDMNHLQKYNFKTKHTPWNKGKPWPEMIGKNNPSWRGGVTESRGDRWSKEYRRWRNAVLRRDNYTCVKCKATKEDDIIQTDHIKPWGAYPELRFEVNNGRTLCWNCHKKTKTYGMNGRKRLTK